MLTRMEFKFSEEKCKEYGVTLNACYKTIEKLMAEDGIHQYGLGVYVAPIKKAFTPFGLLQCRLPRCEWFAKTIESWYWFDSNEYRNYDDPEYNCLMQSQVKKMDKIDEAMRRKVQQVAATMAIEDMYLSKEFI